MAKKFNYLTSGSVRWGPMICNACQKPIEGEYKAREIYGQNKDEDRLVTICRTCSKDDPEWAARDDRDTDRISTAKILLAAAVAFRDKWEVTDLDELIETLNENTKETEA